MQEAKELEVPECAIKECRNFVYMTYQRSDDVGTVFLPRSVCSVYHIRPPGAVSSDFPLPECCLEDCDNEIAPSDCPDHGGPRAACSIAHYILHSAPAPPVRQRRSTKRPPSEPGVAQPTAATIASPHANPSLLLSPVAHTARSRLVLSPDTPINVAQMFDDQAVAEGGSADEVDLSAQQYAIGPTATSKIRSWRPSTPRARTPPRMVSHQPVAILLPPATNLSYKTKRTRMRISTKEARRKRKTRFTLCRRTLSTMRCPNATARIRSSCPSPPRW